MRTRADDVNVCKKMSLLEKMIMSRFFGRKLMMPSLVHWMHNQVDRFIIFRGMFDCFDGI
ncbi:hypothetical protein EON65_05080 [archaeon]|nr:MAG: hypothetical protein EON65_05080 [archaeon]